MAKFGLKVIRFGFASLGPLYPRLAASLAFKLFCLTPSRRPKGHKAAAMQAEGLRKLASARKIPFQAGRSTVMSYHLNTETGARKPRWLVVHGWGSNAAYIASLPVGLAEAGAHVVALDLPGHGLSSGRSLNMKQAAEVIVQADRQFGPFDAVVGHSFGGASLLLTLGKVFKGVGTISPAKAVVIGSPSHIQWIFDGFARMVGLSPKVRELMIHYAEKIAGAPLDDFDTIAAATRSSTPLLVIHAEDDKEVAAEHARRFGEVDTAKVHWANGLGHRRIVSDAGVISTIAQFLTAETAASRAEGKDAAA
ncbi:alpha/beta hydrolase [Rhizobium sp. NTR19]|uniref:Alpha/beta hydrolase n=1 Tax=Neorhizobium turbinariae TaxID=2937795 RepID=A0ABT0ILE2_9HYPH|nr:alpha/beta hydrolase [Neorhizobium turbinariae]MCK8778663.1 alpha/beta hydrolase [Neorhizobium turbinariae]